MLIIFKNILSFLTNPKNLRFILLVGMITFAVLFFRQCEKTKQAEGEVTRIINNRDALKDTIKNYKDKWGNSIGEIKGLNLKIEELNDSIKIEKDKPPITIIETDFVIKDSIIEIPVTIKDTLSGDNNEFTSALELTKENSWGKSTRKISTFIPFNYTQGKVDYGNASIDLEQNIWLSAQLSQNTKTKEVFVKLMTDYPDVTFNDTKGILINKSSKEFKRISYSNRKTFGFGLQIGIGYINNQVSPYIGGGLTYTPKWLQW